MSSEEETLGLLKRASAELRRALHRVGQDDWDLPTPCSEWNVRKLADHLVLGEAAVRPWICGTEFVLDGDLVARSPAAAWDHYAADADAVFREPNTFVRPVEHPVVGTITGEILAGFRLVDRTAHAWDLLVALGQDDALDTTLVSATYDRVLPVADLITTTGVFAPAPQRPPHDADLQTRLLALLGRSRTLP